MVAAARSNTAAWLRRVVHPRAWPVRWRLAAVSSGLTLAILMVFGGMIGQIATTRIRDDFNNEVHNAVEILQRELHVDYSPLSANAEVQPHELGALRRSPTTPRLRVFDRAGREIAETTYPGNDLDPQLGEPEPGIAERKRAADRDRRPATEGVGTGYVQYGRSTEHVDDTIDRIWLLIVAGILGGTLLAGAGRGGDREPGDAADRGADRERARRSPRPATPRSHMPAPPVEDEVGELAKTLEEMLRSLDAARSEREQALQQQREFVADASHELRTPLTSVLANLELLQASLGGADQAEDREVVDSALRSSRRMSRLVSDLLLLARADAGPARPPPPLRPRRNRRRRGRSRRRR